jgi:serine/threonine protein kinase
MIAVPRPLCVGALPLWIIRTPVTGPLRASSTSTPMASLTLRSIASSNTLASLSGDSWPHMLKFQSLICRRLCALRVNCGHAHHQGLVHRDIKPPNVFLLPERNGCVFVKLLDCAMLPAAPDMTSDGALCDALHRVA